MELPTLSFDKAVRPSGEGFKSIRDHPAFCYVCTNFDFAVADALYVPGMGEGLWIDKRIHAVTRTSTMLDLAEAAAGGCGSCQLLRSVAENLAKEAFDPESEDEVTITYWEGTALLFQLGDYLASDHVFELFTLPGEPCFWPSLGNEIVAVDPTSETWQVPGGQALAVTEDPYSDKTFARIEQWMSRCKQDHPYCDLGNKEASVASTLSYCPKRLIDVGNDDSEAKLVKTNNTFKEYVALSYCWGNANGINLLKENEETFLKHLPVDDLLQTHQDAIKITRKLGFRYLWTDGLCIRQNDIDEKIVEIANMDSVYTGAVLTIAGTSARHGNQGCLGHRAQTYKIPIVDEHVNRFNVFTRRQIPHVAWDWNVSDAYSTAARNFFTADSAIMVKYPLFDRGWCFQERLLSRRMLHFTAHEIVFECLGMTCCECGTLDDFVGSRMLRERRYALGVPEDIEVRCGKLERSQKLATRLGLLNYGEEPRSTSPAMKNDYALMYAIRGYEPTRSNHHGQGMTSWKDLITQYSRRQLSFDSDALPAVSGLAKAWVSSLEQPPRYLAGLWEDDLQRGMLWKCIDENPKDRPAKFLAPTWSWASVRRIVDWLSTNEESTQPIYHVEIQHAECEASTINPYGEVKSGEVVVKGRVMKATITGKNDSGSATYAQAGDHSNAFRADCIPEMQTMMGQDVLCLWWSTDVNDARTGMGWERALVLRTVQDQTTERYARVGIMEHFPRDAWEPLLEERVLTII